MKTHHTTKDGKEIPIKDLETDHLKNIIRWIEEKSNKGFTITTGSSGHSGDEYWCDQDHYHGERAKKYLDYDAYVKELDRRNMMTIWETIDSLNERIIFLETKMKNIKND